MNRQVTRKKSLPLRSQYRRNTMAFPRELRGAISEMHGGRVLELDSVTGDACNKLPWGRLVQLKLRVKETGKLTGEFVVAMSLQVDAARQLAATLFELAEKAEKIQAREFQPVVIVKPEKP